jgi:hypothetical protein
MKLFSAIDNEKIIEDRGRLYVQDQDNKRTFLCSLSPDLAVMPLHEDITVISLGRLSETIPHLVRGECPACQTKLEVVEQGRYRCGSCDVGFVNEAGYRFPGLLSEELLRGVVAGRDISEFTTVGIGTMMPRGVAPTIKPEKRYADICPKCFADLNQRGECGKCGWSPDDADKLWEHVVRLVSRIVQINHIGDRVLEFENRNEVCKIYIKETDLGHKFQARLENVSRDTAKAIVGRPKAVINWIADHVSSQPVRPVNSSTVNSPIQETGRRLHTRERGNHTELSHRQKPSSSTRRKS